MLFIDLLSCNGQFKGNMLLIKGGFPFSDYESERSCEHGS